MHARRPDTPTRAERLVIEQPPPTPQCFPGLDEWQDWLLQALEADESEIVRVSDRGAYRGQREVRVVFVAEIDHCADCTARHRARMELDGRCFPSTARKAQDRARLDDRPRERAHPLVALVPAL
jgi:hypothetical protein